MQKHWRDGEMWRTATVACSSSFTVFLQLGCMQSRARHYYLQRRVVLVTWLHLRTHHLWRTIKEVGLLSEDHLPQSMTQPVQLLNQTIHLHPNTSHFAHYTISAIEGVATHALPFSSCFCPLSSPSHIPLIPPFPLSLSYPPTQRLWPPEWCCIP